MAQGYAWEMAQLWSRAAETDLENRSGLLESARRAERVSGLAADSWPVQAREIREVVAKFERMRYFDPDNPDAMIDLQGYAGRVRAVTVALLSLLGDESEEAGAMLFRIMSFDMTFASVVATDWNFEGELLANLLQRSRCPTERWRSFGRPPPPMGEPQSSVGRLLAPRPLRRDRSPDPAQQSQRGTRQRSCAQFMVILDIIEPA